MNADELEQLGRRVRQPHLAPSSPRGELQSRERVHGHGVRLDPAHVAPREGGSRRGEETTDTVAQPGKIGACDRSSRS